MSGGTRPGRILVVDDEKRWRELLSDILSSGGFLVDTAATKKEAVERLSSGLYHLAVLDIRMKLQDTSNEQGMELLRECGVLQYGDAIKVIVLSAFGTEDQMREAFRDYKVADFVDKKKNFLDTAFLERVRDLFRNKLEINLGLDFRWQGGLDPDKAVKGLLVDGFRIKGKGKKQEDKEAAEMCAIELEDLLCRLFSNAKEVLLNPFGTVGLSGTGILLAQPTYAHGGGRPVVVKFGDVQRIEKEYQNFVEYVQPYVSGGRCTHVQTQRRTPRLGGIVYSLLEQEGELLEDFARFYRRAETPEILHLIDQLFGSTCKPWYSNLGQIHVVDLTRSYMDHLGMKIDSLERGKEALRSTVQGKDRLHFRSLSNRRACLNPLLALERQPIGASTYETITHGDFNEQNILVDAGGHCWLIDFQGTGPGHILRDVTRLDAAIRLRLLAPEEATLDERLALEEALNSADNFRQAAALASRQPATNPAVAKAFTTCAHLRGLAARLVANNPSADIKEYFAGSLYWALNMIRFLSLPHLLREHAMLSASLLAERLGL